MDQAKPFSIPKREVWEAFKRVKANQGAAGVDGQSIAEFEANLSGEPLQALEPPVLGELLSSAGASRRDSEGEWRDAAVGHSDGCRPHRPGGHPALRWSRSWSRCSTPTPTATDPASLPSMPWRKARERCWRSDWVLDLDIKAFFDSIDWELMLKAVRHHTDCPWVLLYIERWLKAPVQMEDGSIVARTTGTPQGGVISPLLANLFLHYAVRHVDGAGVPAHPVRAVCRRCDLSLQKRGGGACPAGRAHRPTGRVQADAASREDEDRLLQGCEPEGRLHPNIRFDFLGFQFRARKTMWMARQGRIFAHSFQPAASPKALVRIGREIRRWALHHRSDKSLEELARMYNPIHPRLDRLLQPLLPDAAPSDAEADRCLCHSMGPPQVQADGSSDQGWKRLVRPAPPEDAEALCPLVPMSWQRPNIGSRVTREGHARFWERPGVKVPRATRHLRRLTNRSLFVCLTPQTAAVKADEQVLRLRAILRRTGAELPPSGLGSRDRTLATGKPQSAGDNLPTRQLVFPPGEGDRQRLARSHTSERARWRE